MTFKVVYAIFRKVEKYPEALRIAIRLNDKELAQEVFDACNDQLTKKQLCFMLARHGTINIETDDDDLMALMGNSQLSEHFRASFPSDLLVFPLPAFLLLKISACVTAGP